MFKTKVIQVDRWHNDEHNRDYAIAWVACENGLPIKVWIKQGDYFKEGDIVEVYACPDKNVFGTVYIRKV